MRSHRLTSATSAVVVIAALCWAGTVSADLSRPVITAFRGQLVITKGDLPEGKSDKETIAKIKTEQLKELVGEPHADAVFWRFHYTAFLSKAGASSLRMEFLNKDNQLSADKRLDDVDPKSEILSGDIEISEDDGLSKGKAYTIRLVNDKNAAVASTPLVMK